MAEDNPLALRDERPYPLPAPSPIPKPQDIPFPGTLRLEVDATDVDRRIFSVRETIPVAAGPMTLVYPKWLPGLHSPQAPIELLAGLVISANGERLKWIRHPVTINAFQIDVPNDATEIVAEFQFLSPTDPSHGRVLVSRDMLMLPWNSVILNPAGHFARQIMVEAVLTLPDAWAFASALEEADRSGPTVRFRKVSLDMLVDSPVLAGRFFNRVALDDEGLVHLNMAADRPELLEIQAGQIGPHRELVTQCDHLFGTRHFRHYDVLLALSDELDAEGIEHHQSCEAVSIPDYFTGGDRNFPRRNTIPHEYLHSWNGKHRRGADSWSPCFEEPIRNSLMWVYEGLTQYWTYVMCARSGMWSEEHVRGALAQAAATFDVHPGSCWRPLIDTTRDPIIAARNPLPWKSWQRSEDYYSEGALIWLDVDTRLRALTGEGRSLDDFARLFFGADDGVPVTHTYMFEDVVAALAKIAPFDWQGFFEAQLTETRDGTDLSGLERGGYKLIFADTPNTYVAAFEALAGTTDLSFSIGLTTTGEGKINDVLWDGPAFAQSITAGSVIQAVNDRPFSVDILKDAVAATSAGEPLQLIVKSGNHVRGVRLNYDGGARYPDLERIADVPARLDAILAARLQ
jgi:predicted metalloprotease with PDZ domain